MNISIRGCRWLLLLCLSWSAGVQAELLLVPGQAVAAAGTRIELVVYAHADAMISGADDFPVQLQLLWRNAAGDTNAVLAQLKQRHADPATVSASYQLDLPRAAAAGLLELRIEQHSGSLRSKPAYVLINNPQQLVDGTQTLAAAGTGEAGGQGVEVQQKPSAEELVQVASEAENIDEEATRNPFRDNIMAYEPVYFIAGASPSNAKFQLSFKYRFLHPDTNIAERHPWLTGFYMAYSQTSFWDLSSESIPFTDTNFKPELFYQFNDVRFSFLPDTAYADLRTGVQHESNGEDEERSRSLNIAYLEPAMHFRFGDDYLFSLTPRVWAYVGSKVDNPDIRRFRGNNSITATFSKRDSWQLETMLRGNIGTGRGALQMDLSYPVNQLLPGLDLYLYSQFFTGFGENLLNYNVKDTRLRFGIGILR